MLISSVFIVLVSLCFSLFCTLAVVGFHTHLVNGFGIFLCFTPFVCVSVFVCQRNWITYLILLCFYVIITCVCLCLEGITLNHFIFRMLCLTAICSILGVCGFHCSSILMFYACSYLLWYYLCYPSLFH